MRLTIKSIWLALLLGGLIGHSAVVADLGKGKRVFNKYKSCHVFKRKKNRVGPHLMGLFGRKAGRVDECKYSEAMKAAGIIWSEKTLDEYLTSPKKYVKGTKMAFAGLKKKMDRANVIAYLKRETEK